MAESLGVDPHNLRGTAEHLSDVKARFDDVLTRLHEKLAAEGSPWGDDKTGKDFSEGPNGYLAQKDWVDQSVGDKCDVLQWYADGLHDAANVFEQSG
jgi:hypothetical protein